MHATQRVLSNREEHQRNLRETANEIIVGDAVTLFHRHALDVPMLSEKIISDLVSGLSLHSVSEFFALEERKEEVLQILRNHYPKFSSARRYYTRLINAIAISRVTTFKRFLMSVPGYFLHDGFCDYLAMRFNSVEEIVNSWKNDRESFKDIFDKEEMRIFGEIISHGKLQQLHSSLVDTGIITWGQPVLVNGKQPWEGMVFYYANPSFSLPLSTVRANVLAMGGRLSNIMTNSVDVVLYDDAEKDLKALGLDPNAHIEYWRAIEPMEAVLYHFS